MWLSTCYASFHGVVCRDQVRRIEWVLVGGISAGPLSTLSDRSGEQSSGDGWDVPHETLRTVMESVCWNRSVCSSVTAIDGHGTMGNVVGIWNFGCTHVPVESYRSQVVGIRFHASFGGDSDGIWCKAGRSGGTSGVPVRRPRQSHMPWKNVNKCVLYKAAIISMIVLPGILMVEFIVVLRCGNSIHLGRVGK